MNALNVVNLGKRPPIWVDTPIQVPKSLFRAEQACGDTGISPEKWEAMQETLFLTSLAGMQDSIEKSMAEPLTRRYYSRKIGQWDLFFSSYAVADVKKLFAADLMGDYITMIDDMQKDPMSLLAPYRTLVGELKGACSKKVNYHQRLVFELFPDEKIIRILRLQ